MNSNVVLIAVLILVKVLVIGVRHANAHDNSLLYNPPSQSYGYDYNTNWAVYYLDNNRNFLELFNKWN